MAAMEQHEILLATEDSGQQGSVTAFDLHTFSSIYTLTGQAVAARSLCMQNEHTLIGASASRPVLQFWPLHLKDVPSVKKPCPGNVTALAVSPDGLFCAAAIRDKLCIWEMTSGSLLGVVSDFDEVKVIRFIDGGSKLIIGTQGGWLKILDFARFVCRSQANQTPLLSLLAHAEEITDMCVGCNGSSVRVVTASKDMFCKLWDVVSGQMICSFRYESHVCSVIMDRQEHHIIAGLQNGDVCCSPLYNQESKQVKKLSTKTTDTCEIILKGDSESGAVVCLAFSSDCQRLASGTWSGYVKMWDMSLRSVIKSMKLSESSIGNLMFIPSSTWNTASTQLGLAVSFKQQMTGDETGKGRIYSVNISDTSQCLTPDYNIDISKMMSLGSKVHTVIAENKPKRSKIKGKKRKKQASRNRDGSPRAV